MTNKKKMKIHKMKNLIVVCCLLVTSLMISQNAEVLSPNSKLKLNVSVENGKFVYAVTYNDKVILENSPLGLITNEGDFTQNMSFIESSTDKVNKSYTEDKIKQSSITYDANTLKFTIENADKKQLSVLFQVSDNDIAFRYEIPSWGETMSCVVEKEITGYKFPSHTTTFLSPMMSPMTGFARTTPSYEATYTADVAMDTNTDTNGN